MPMPINENVANDDFFILYRIWNNFKEAVNGSDISPVSYTHLDVYKRQVLEE